ncbi:MAG: cysteine--tRNA ligase [Gammaproteobacteria bacterium]|nr:cysteine--tRNA ligase [Gammaproteobacteria bacterium]
MLKIYNTLTKRKEPFQSITPNEVTIYVCGLTVYNDCHIGNARSIFVVFDMVIRYLKEKGYKVKYVRNITDIDDKIIKKAEEGGVDYAVIAEKYAASMHEVETALEVIKPDFEPKATENMDNIIAMIEDLVAKDYAYIATNGDVYFDVHKFGDYGKLAEQDLDSFRAGARVDVNGAKQDPLDFVLWKMVKPGEPSWSSPWGEGRPGWHIECSAMSTCYLGKNFDIHGGGADLKFPHHQNEIAQSEAANGINPVNYWMHVGYVEVDKQKMSKSLGNFFTLKDVLEKYDPEVIKFFMLSSHYRSPLNYSELSLQQAKAALTRLYITKRDVSSTGGKLVESYYKRFCDAMDGDFNTPEAIAILFELANKAHQKQNIEKAANYSATLDKLAAILGFLQRDPAQFLQTELSDEFKLEVENLIKERNQARADKDWSKADKIRDQLTAMNIVLEDGGNGTAWRYLH